MRFREVAAGRWTAPEIIRSSAGYVMRPAVGRPVFSLTCGLDSIQRLQWLRSWLQLSRNYRFSDNLPNVSVVPVHLGGAQPAVLDQNSSRVECALSISGARSIGENISRADAGLVPVL
jgi:hypothetical protein